MVDVGTDVNLLILLSKLSHHKAKLCKPEAGDIYRTTQPSQRLPQRQHIKAGYISVTINILSNRVCNTEVNNTFLKALHKIQLSRNST